ncbi:MAG: twin-arginine translocation signal domain-containing protein [Gemmatimonadota bacterium]|nr:twin-arginine translocation signal domain-containing protein [Gemmatimonadota bacterium]
MAISRRTFLHNSGVAAAALGLVTGNSSKLLAASSSLRTSPLAPFSPSDPAARELAMLAIDTAKTAGANYADARVCRNNSRFIGTQQARVAGLGDNETFGIGIRVLVGGSWGFAATSDLTRDEVARTRKLAVLQAKADRVAQRRPVQLAPVTPTGNGTWRSNAKIDPFDVPIEQQVALLIQANEAALKVLKPGGQGVGFVSSSMFFLREEKSLATTDGTFVVQTVFRAQPSLTWQAVNRQERAVKNLRWNESPILMLNNVEMMGKPERVSASESGSAAQALVVPPVKARDFTFTSLSDAV